MDVQFENSNNVQVVDVMNFLSNLYILPATRVTMETNPINDRFVEIFSLFGASAILNSDNGREFSNAVIRELASKWEGCKLVHGKPRHSQTQGSVERCNQDVENILRCYLKDNNTNQWVAALPTLPKVQWMKNSRLHTGTSLAKSINSINHFLGIGRCPYEAMFGVKPRLGLSPFNLPDDVVAGMEIEEQLEDVLNQLDAD